MVDEVLGADVSACAAQYVVAVYMTSARNERAGAVGDAIEEMQGVDHFWEPLREMERVAVEPLHDLDDFFPAPSARKAVLRAMRQAAEKRLAGVTENKRRRCYGHAAELVAICQALDPTPDTHRWVSGIRAAYRRYPALQQELARYVGPR